MHDKKTPTVKQIKGLNAVLGLLKELDYKNLYFEGHETDASW